MVLSGMLSGLLIDWIKACSICEKMDVIWTGVMSLSETHLFRLEHIPFVSFEVVHKNTNMLS